MDGCLWQWTPVTAAVEFAFFRHEPATGGKQRISDYVVMSTEESQAINKALVLTVFRLWPKPKRAK